MAFIATTLFVIVIAAPALAAEDGILETSSVVLNDDLMQAEFARTITNTSASVVAIEPRDLRMAEYPRMTAVEVTVGGFADGIWTVGLLDPNQSATIIYVGSAAAPEELPFTGSRERLTALAILGILLIAFGTLTVRSTRA